jgi:hypothetical protein
MLALLLLLITINNRSDSPRFIAPFVPLAAILTAIALHDLLSAYPKVAAWLRGDSANHRLFRPTMAQPIDWATQTVSRLFTLAPIAIAALLLWNLRHFQTKAAYTLTTFDQVVALCRSEFSGHNLVVPQVYAPTLRWYLQPSRVRGYIDLRQALRNSQEIKLGIVVIPAIQILEWQQTSANTSTLKTALSQFGLVAIEL